MKRFARLALLSALLAALAVPAAGIAASVGAQSGARVPALDSGVLAALNAVRSAHGLRPLRVSPALSAAASQHSLEMVADDYFSHSSADGTSFDDRITRFYPLTSRYHRWAAGENLVFGAPDLTAGEAVRLWMGSPEHRRNVLDPTWREIGISAVHTSTAGPTFGGGEATVITADFGARS